MVLEVVQKILEVVVEVLAFTLQTLPTFQAVYVAGLAVSLQKTCRNFLKRSWRWSRRSWR